MIILIMWIKTLHMRSSLYDWVAGNGIPSSGTIGALNVILLMILPVWYVFRNCIDEKIALKRKSKSISLLRGGAILIVLLPVFFQWTFDIPFILTRNNVTMLFFPKEDDIRKLPIDWLRDDGFVQPQTFVLGPLDLSGLRLLSPAKRNVLENVIIDFGNIRMAHLDGNVVKNSFFRGATLWKSELDEVQIIESNFDHARIGKSKMRFMLFWLSSAKRATLKHLDLLGANLSASNLRGSKYIDNKMEGTIFANGVNMQCSVFIETDLSFSYLRKTRLEGALFIGVNLEGADLGGAYVEGARFINCKMTGANLLDINTRSLDQSNYLENEYDPRIIECLKLAIGESPVFEKIEAEWICGDDKYLNNITVVSNKIECAKSRKMLFEKRKATKDRLVRLFKESDYFGKLMR